MKILSVMCSILLFTVASHATEISNYKRCAGVDTPKDGGKHFWSDDCKTVYLLPPVYIETNTTLVLRPEALAYCKEVREQTDTFAKEIERLTKELKIKDMTREEFKANQDEATKIFHQMGDIFKKPEMAIMADTDTTITIDTSQKYLKAVAELNSELVKSGVQFLPMPLAERYFSISDVKNFVVYGAHAENGALKLLNDTIRFTGSINANYVCGNLDKPDSLKSLNSFGTATVLYNTKEGSYFETAITIEPGQTFLP